MSTLFLSIGNFFSIFENVTECFSGSFTDDNAEVREMRKQLRNEPIHVPNTDRQNLKKDGANIVSDYKKAYEAKKEELSL